MVYFVTGGYSREEMERESIPVDAYRGVMVEEK